MSLEKSTVPAHLSRARIPGQVPSRDALQVLRLAQTSPVPFHPAMLLRHTGPVFTLDHVVRGLGMDRETEATWKTFLRDASQATNEGQFRRTVLSKTLGDRMDPAQRRVLFEKALSFWREQMRKSMQAEWIDTDRLEKAAGHKYLRRIPTGKECPRWRYIYHVESKHHDTEFHPGEKFKLKSGEQTGHYEVKKVHGDFVTLHHDESGHEVSVRKDALAKMFRDEHATRDDEGSKTKAKAAYGASEKANKEASPQAHREAATAHQEAADAGAVNAKLHRDLATMHERAAVTAEARAKIAEEKRPPKFVLRIERKPRPGMLGTKDQSYRALLNELGPGSKGSHPDFVAADERYKLWKEGKGPKPKPWQGGELDSINEALGLRKPTRLQKRKRGVKDNRVTSLREGWERLTTGITRWDDPKMKQALEALRSVPGLESARIPEEAREHFQREAEGSGFGGEEEEYHRQKMAEQAAGDLEFEPDTDTEMDDSFDFGWNAMEKSFGRLGDRIVNVWTLQKAEARGGSYHRRIPKPGGGFRYIYDAEKYASREDAHVSGSEARKAAMCKNLSGAVEKAGEEGCDVKALKPLAQRYGREDLVKEMKGRIKSGEWTYKGGRLYKAKAKDDPKPKAEPKPKGKKLVAKKSPKG